MLNKSQAIYGIIGNPVAHSLSPVMQNTAFKALGVDAVYKLFPLEEEEVKPFFEELKLSDSPIFGLNVTVPYKEKVVEYVDAVTPLAEKLMAINTIVISQDRKLTGYNTDAPGFLTHLTELKVSVAGRRVAILGAGGSARAIIATLCMIPDRPQSIKIYNRTISRVEELLADLGQRMDVSIVEPVRAIDDLDIELSDLLINTTSVGMGKDDVSLVEPELIHSNLFVYDLIYNPTETPLIKIAKSRGVRTANGLGMLYYQGLLSLQHWANMEIDESIRKKMRDSLERGLT